MGVRSRAGAKPHGENGSRPCPHFAGRCTLILMLEPDFDPAPTAVRIYQCGYVSPCRAGWRAAEKGTQIIRMIFDKPKVLRRIVLEFSENKIERTQEFVLLWATEAHGPFREITRQQWTFSPQGSTDEIEDYQVHLEGVSILELTIKPNLAPENAVATLRRWRVA
jgi:hypothetical protein